MLRGAAFKQAGAAIKAAAKTLCKINRKTSSSEARAGFLGYLGDDLACGGIDLGLGQGFFARLQGDRYSDRFLAFRYALAFIDIEDTYVRDERAFARGSGLDDVGCLYRSIDQEGKIALHGHELRKFELRFGSCEPQFRRRYVIKKQFETSNRPLCADGFESARMDLAKRANDIFWPKLNRGGAAGVKPGGTAGDKLDTAGRNTERRKKSKSVSLDIEGIDSGGCQRPMPPGPCFLRQPSPDSAGGDLLTVFAVARKDLPDLEKRDVAMATVGVALRRRDQPWQQAWPHIGKLRGNRIGERQGSPAAAKHLRTLARDERPCHRFDKAVGGQRAFGALDSLLHQSQHRFRDRVSGRARQWGRRDTVEPSDTQDFFDEIGLALDVGSERGRLHQHFVGVAGKIREFKPKTLENAGHFRAVEFEPSQPFHLAPRKHDASIRMRNPPRKSDLRGSATAKLNHQ